MTAAMAESVVDDEAMAILGAASEAEDGSKLAYITTGLAVRLAPTPPYEAPDTEEFMKGHSVDKLTPDVGGFRVAVAQHVPQSVHGVGVPSGHQAEGEGWGCHP